MKLLFVIPEFPPDFGGGIGSYYGAFVPALRAQGCEVKILKGSAFVHGEKSYKHEDILVSVLETERFEKWAGRFEHFTMFPELRRHLAAAFALHEQANEGDGFDVVEVTDWGMLFLPWIIKAHSRVMVELHGSNGQIALNEQVIGREAEQTFSIFLEKLALKSAPTLSAQSRANILWWKNNLSRPVNYLPPPLKQNSAQEKISSNGWLAIGRIQHWKGPQVACSAWELLGKQAPPLNWIGGDTVHGESGESASTWLQQKFPTVWEKKIQPIGRVTSDQWLQRICAAKVVVIPSLWDTYNLVAAEAMSLGKVVVISDGAGAADLVQHGVNGFIFPKGDAAALAKLVEHVENLNQEELEEIGQTAAVTVRKQLDPTHIAAEKIKLYRSLPEPEVNQLSWLRECLLPATKAKPLAFLDGLPLKDLTAYVARRGLKKISR